LQGVQPGEAPFRSSAAALSMKQENRGHPYCGCVSHFNGTFMKKNKLRSLGAALVAAVAVISTSASAQVSPVGTHYYNNGTNGSLPANTVVQIFSATDNAHGAIVQTCAETIWGSSWGLNTLVIASPTQPTPFVTGNIVLFSVLVPPISSAQLPHPVYIPAGNGLWGYTSGQGSIYCNYDLMS
jgi:hypothetical protein